MLQEGYGDNGKRPPPREGWPVYKIRPASTAQCVSRQGIGPQCLCGLARHSLPRQYWFAGCVQCGHEARNGYRAHMRVINAAASITLKTLASCMGRGRSKKGRMAIAVRRQVDGKMEGVIQPWMCDYKCGVMCQSRSHRDAELRGM